MNYPVGIALVRNVISVKSLPSLVVTSFSMPVNISSGHTFGFLCLLLSVCMHVDRTTVSAPRYYSLWGGKRVFSGL